MRWGLTTVQPGSAVQVGRRGSWKGGPHDNGRRERRWWGWNAQPKEENVLAEDAKGVHGPLGWLGRLGQISRKDSSGNWFLNFVRFWNLASFWEILQGDIEGIWTWGFFLNSFRLLKDF
jgi:hypothetical protein